MPRLIDADWLKSEIQRRRKRYKTLTGVDMAMLVDDAPTVGGWISVEDEQPKTTGFYVTWCRSDLNKDGFYRVSEYSAEERGWYDFIHHDFNDTTTRFWMPIPKAPKEEA